MMPYFSLPYSNDNRKNVNIPVKPPVLPPVQPSFPPEVPSFPTQQPSMPPAPPVVVSPTMAATPSLPAKPQTPQNMMQPEQMLMPGKNMPVMNMPDMNMPGMNMPVMNMPAMNMPVMNMPVMNMPAMNMPAMNMPAMNMPVMNMPGMNMTAMNMPGMNMPAMNMPAGTPVCPFTGMPLFQGTDGMGDMSGMGGMGDMGSMADINYTLFSPAPSISDPPPVLSNNPAVANITLFKELTGYPNYGNPSGNADILYRGNRGTWTFELPAFLFVPGNLRARLTIRACLDDHANVPVNRYSARITINGAVVHNGPLSLQHGVPAGGMFTNWRSLPFTVANMRRSTRVVIENTSTTGDNDWIAFDWMEMRFLPR